MAARGIYRITDYRNLPFILENGFHCANSPIKDENFVQIGFPTLIDIRKDRHVPVEPGGVLGDYIPFYFGRKSPMLYVIARGNDPEVVGNQEDIVYLVSTVQNVVNLNARFVYTDRNAKLEYATFRNDVAEIDYLNWDVINSDQWGRQYGEDRKELKQAEFLVHNNLPINSLIGIGCKTQTTLDKVNSIILQQKINLETKLKPEWYYDL